MFFILENAVTANNPWRYTFIYVMTIAIIIGMGVTYFKVINNRKKNKKNLDTMMQDEKILDNEDALLKKKKRSM